MRDEFGIFREVITPAVYVYELSLESGRLVGIEIIDASKKLDLKTMLSYTLSFDTKEIFNKISA